MGIHVPLLLVTPCQNHPSPIDQIQRFEVTWLGLHAFGKVFTAFATNHKGFTLPASDMQRALRESELVDGPSSGPKEPGQDDGQIFDRRVRTSNSPRRRAYARLRGIVRAPDALKLLQNLTIGNS